MKSKFKYYIYVTALLWSALLPRMTTAQKVPAAPPLSPKLQGYAKAESNANWIDFREGFNFNPQTIFTDLSEGFGLGANDEMRLMKTEADDLGFHHYRYQQYYKSTRVEYGEFVVHQNSEGVVQGANGRIITGLQADNKPVLSENVALSEAIRFVGAKKYLWQNEEMQAELKRQEKNRNATYYPKGVLVYAPDNYEATFLAKDYKLAWMFIIYPDAAEKPAQKVYIDAATGKVIRHIDVSMSCNSTPSTVASGFNGNVTIRTQLNSGTYRSLNDCQSTNMYVYNCSRGSATTTFYTSSNNTNWGASAVQAQYGVAQTYAYYNGNHSRQSWDGSNGDMIAYNNAVYGNPATANNACWGCFGNATIFGAGNTTAATDDWNTDDIMGHEFTHGVTQASANLDYNKESGALNESFSDIFGEMVESYTEGNCDYLVGNDRGAIRSFINPNTYGDPDTYQGTNWYNTSGCSPAGSNDNCGVHTNSGVQNHWFYLLSEGGTGTNDNGESYNVTGISRFSARLIAYRALTVYLNSSSQYIDARSASLHAARDLYGGCSTEEIAVGDAWHAVGVEGQSSGYTVNVCGTVSTGGFSSPQTQGIHLVTGGNGCSNTVTSSTDVRYYAARDRVVLYPGFRAQAGSRFIAYLEPCSVTIRKPGANSSLDAPRSDAERNWVNMPALTARRPNVPEEETTVSIVPNPFQTQFDVFFKSTSETKADVRVYNFVGVMVMQKAGTVIAKGANKFSFDGSRLPSGTYVVEIQSGSERTIRKVIKM